MDPGDVGTSSIARDIWTALYTGVEGAEKSVYLLFTVARDEMSAEHSFESYLVDQEGADSDIPAPDTIGKIDFLPGESCLHATARLHQLGYRFVFPIRGQINDSEVAGLTRKLLQRTDIDE